MTQRSRTNWSSVPNTETITATVMNDIGLDIGDALAGVNVAGNIHAATSKTTPVDADEFGGADSAASFGLKKFTWANIKAALKTYFDTLYVVIGGALGTPLSGTLTNCTGLPVSGITASTTQAVGVGTVELGHASDTTLSRSSAGVLAVEGVVVPTVSSTNTLTNKRVVPRVGSTTSSATPTINTDNVDVYGLTAQTADITSMTTNLTGTPTDSQPLWIYIVGTAARAITWGSKFENGAATLPTTTVTTQRLDVVFVWNPATSKWRCMDQWSA